MTHHRRSGGGGSGQKRGNQKERKTVLNMQREQHHKIIVCVIIIWTPPHRIANLHRINMFINCADWTHWTGQGRNKQRSGQSLHMELGIIQGEDISIFSNKPISSFSVRIVQNTVNQRTRNRTELTYYCEAMLFPFNNE